MPSMAGHDAFVNLSHVDLLLAQYQQNPRSSDQRRRSLYPSPDSQTGTPTCSESTEPHDIEQRLCDARRIQLMDQRDASRAYNQFEYQVKRDAERLRDAESHGTRAKFVDASVYDERAREIVKEKWRNQGIYNEDWTLKSSPWLWAHEKSIAPGSDTRASQHSNIFGQATDRPRLNSERKQQLGAELRRYHCEASRPFNQFMYQLLKESEQLLAESTNGSDVSIAADINTKAYENTVKDWTQRGVWDRKWGVLPAWSWMHEEPSEEECVDRSALVQTGQPEDGTNGNAVVNDCEASSLLNPLERNMSPGENSGVNQDCRAHSSSSQGRIGRHSQQVPSMGFDPFDASEMSRRDRKSTIQPSSHKRSSKRNSTAVRRSSRLESLQSSRVDLNASVTNLSKVAKRPKLKGAATGKSKCTSSRKAMAIPKNYL